MGAMQEKNIVQSKTAWGAAAMLLALGLSKLGVHIESTQLEAIFGQGVDGVQLLLGVGGFLWTLYGRFQASGPVKFW
jgi:hypothetical protein